MPAAAPSSQGCCIVGAGPAGLMLGLLLARAGVTVTVVEKHTDFLRDFRGDTIHPSTLEAMHELGMLDELLALPHQRAAQLHAEIGGRSVAIADFARLPTQCRFIAFMPQWDFLDFLARKAAAWPGFRLRMGTEATGLLWRDGRVAGIRARDGTGEVTLDADLVVATDGRNSVLRAAAELPLRTFGAPTDVLWMRLSRQPSDPPQVMGHAGPRQGLVLIDRGDFWQCGYVVRKGGFAAVKQAGLPALRAALAQVAPLPAERFEELRDWDQVRLLSVRIDRLGRWWRDGLLCLGDAAHAMSPIGGVGVNLAIQDAIAAANILAAPLRDGRLTAVHLRAVERRRRFPTWATQRLQLMMRSRNRARDERAGPPGFMRAIARWRWLPHLTGRLIGLGFRPEHVRSRAAAGG